jgi:hypothetical protein
LPPTVTGAETTGTTCVPDAVPSAPEFTGPDPTAGEAVVPAPDPDGAGEPDAELLSPRIDTALPPTVTGAATSGTTCVPDAMPSAPEVTGPDPDAGAEDSVVLADDVPVDAESPTTLTALPDAAIGTSTLMRPCVPPRRESLPVVVAGARVAAGAGAEAGAGAGAVDPVEVESPITEMALPETLTGAATGATTWVPEAVPSEPEVVAFVGAGVGAGAGVDAGAAALAGAGAVLAESPTTLIALPVA